MPLFVEGAIQSVGDDDVVEEFDVHQLACPQNALRQIVVGSAGTDAAAGVIMTDGKDGGIAE